MNVDRLDQLLARVRAGDEAAYRQFLAKAADRLRADLRRQVPGEDALEDILRQCLISVHRKRHTLDPDQPARPWLSAIGYYVLTGHRRKRGKAPARLLAADTANGMARLVNLDHASGRGQGARSAAILGAMMVRVRRGVQRKPQMVDRPQA